MIKRFFALILLVLLFGLIYPANVSTVKSGSWSDPSVWSTGTVPVDGDNISIGHSITVDANYDYSSSNLTINWAGSITIEEPYQMTVSSVSSSNGGGSPNQINGKLIVLTNFTQSGGTVNIGENGSIIVTGDYSLSGGSSTNLNVNGLLEVETLTNSSSAVITIGPNGQIIVHGDYTNKSGADITINGGEMTIEGSYVNQGDGTIVINDGGYLYIQNGFTNTGGSQITVNDGTVVIDGDVSNRGGSQFDIADGSSVEVNGDFTNTGGGDVVVDGSLDVEGTLTNSGGGTITGNGSIYAGNVDDRNGGIDPNLLQPKDFYTIASGNWTDGTIWSKTDGGTACNCSPGINSRVIIKTGTSVTLKGTVKPKKVVIEDGAVLTLDAQANLTVIDTLEIDGQIIFRNDGSSSPNLIDEGKILYGSNPKITTKIYVSGYAYHYLSSFIPGVTVDSLRYIDGLYNPNVYQYDETAADHWGEPNDDDGSNDFLGWVTPSNTMEPGQGFAVFTDRAYTFTLEGSSLTTGDVAVNVTYTVHPDLPDNTTYDGWNLIGNPYPSGISVTQFLSDNSSVITGNVYIWDDDNSGGSDYNSQDYIQVNLAGEITNSQKGSTFDGIIAPNQAFFVQATTNGTVYFHNTQRDNTSTSLLKNDVQAKSTITSKIKLALKAQDYNLYNELLLAFSPLATDGFDIGYDGIKKKGNPNIAFYSLLNGEDMGIQSFSDDFTQKKINLGFDVTQPGTYTIVLKTLENMDYYDIVLHDNYLDKDINLKQQGGYKFDTKAGFFKDRFTLVVTRYFADTQEPKQQPSSVYIYTDNTRLYVFNQGGEDIEDARLRIVDISGRVVYSAFYNIIKGYETKSIPLPPKGGYYIVTFKTNDFVLTKIFYLW